MLWEFVVCPLPLHPRQIGVSRQKTNLNDIDLAQDQFRFRRGTPLHSSELFPLRRPLHPPPRCLVIHPHIPDDVLVLLLLDTGILPASPRLGCVPHLHFHVAGILVHSLQLTNVAL